MIRFKEVMTAFSSRLNYHPLILGLIIGTSISRGFTLMCMPFFALHLTSHLQLSPVFTGAIIGLSPLVITIVSFLSGILSDKIGPKRLMLMGLCGTSVTFFGFGYAFTGWQFAVLNGFNGFFIALFTPSASVLFSELLDQSNRSRAFHFRYYCVNVAAMVAPIFGVKLFLTNHQVGFFVTSFIFGIYALIMAILFDRYSIISRKTSIKKSKNHIKDSLSMIFKDRLFLLFLLSSFIIDFAYSQFESTIPQIINHAMKQDGIYLFGFMNSLNGLTVVLAQPLILRLLGGRSNIVPLVIGSFAFSLSFALFSFQSNDAPLWILSSLIFTLGEIMIYAYSNIVIDGFAPSEWKGTYFGASEMSKIGLAIGPWMGGFLFESIGGLGCFLSISSLCFLVGMIHLKWTRIRINGDYSIVAG